MDLLFWGGIVLALLLALYIAGTWSYRELKTRGLPFEKPLPFVGNFGAFMVGKRSQGDLAMDFYKKFDGHRAYGFFSLNQPCIFIRDPEVIRLIAVKDFDAFTDHLAFVEEVDDKLLGKSIFNLKGARWKAMRSTLSPAFTSSKMKSMYTLIDKCGEQLADYLHTKAKDGLIHLEMKDLFTRYTNDVIATSAYGLHCDSLNEPENEFYKMGLKGSDFGGIRALLMIGIFVCPKLLRFLGLRLTPLHLENFFCSTITDTIATREREKIIRPDMIHLLMQARKGTLKEDGDETHTKPALELSDDDIAAQAFIFFLAGFETSSTLLSFLSYELAVHPDIQDRVREEIDEVLASNDGLLSYDAVQKMKYLDTVISETLRFWPPLPELDRMCLRDYTVPATDSDPEIVIKKGDVVQFPAYGLHFDPAYWPEPERFDPDRFSDENKQNIKPFTYMPFGLGPRACIGNRFALMEAKIAIASVLSKVTLEVTEKTPIPIRLQKGTFNLCAQGGMWLGFKRRS